MNISISDVLDTFVGTHTTVREVMSCINSSRQHIALVVDDSTRLIETLTDGDIRRAILDGVAVDATVSEICKHKRSAEGTVPITASVDAERTSLFALMKTHSVRQVPLVNETGQVVGLVTLEEVLPDQNLAMNAVIMAGGFGKRLLPLTKDIPKPMLPVGNKPLMEHTIQQLSNAGIQNVKISTHYMAEKIVDHFQDGSAFGVNVSY
ncbi:MAG: sugar phosphate nucleotidyltransferase, partial [Chthonomonadales bacterium]